MSDGPDELMTELAQLAHQIHEAFTAYLEAGFTEAQALYLTACIACGGPKP
jgi:hypothetical protein